MLAVSDFDPFFDFDFAPSSFSFAVANEATLSAIVCETIVDTDRRGNETSRFIPNHFLTRKTKPAILPNNWQPGSHFVLGHRIDNPAQLEESIL